MTSIDSLYPHVFMIAAIGCSASETAPVAVIQRYNPNTVENGIRETATVRIDSSGVRTLVATLTLENLGTTDRPILWGLDCLGNGPLDARMYRGSTLVWEASRSRPLLGCPVRAIQSAISAGGSVSFAWHLPVKVDPRRLAPCRDVLARGSSHPRVARSSARS